MRLILASASPRRRDLLALLGVPFEVVPPAYEEVVPSRHEDPAELARHLAREKALQVAQGVTGPAFVIGADTIVVLGRRILGKPKDADDAAAMLRALSGKTHQVVTGVAVVMAPGLELEAFHTSTDVTFRALEEEEIASYIGTGEPLDKAGAYAIQGRAALFIEGIRGDYPNVVGLPVAPLALLLRRLGVPIAPLRQ